MYNYTKILILSRGKIMKRKNIGKLAVVLAASTALVATLINDKKTKKNI